MKKVTLFLILFISINTINAQNKEEEKPQSDFKYHKSNSIYLAPGNFTFRNIQVGYERFINTKNSVVVKANYGSDLNRYNSYNDPNSFVVNAELSYRKYILYSIIKKEKVADKEKQNLYGLYVSPFIGYQYSKDYDYFYNGVSSSLVEYNNSAILGGIYIGNRFDLAKGLITIDMYFGGGVKGLVVDNTPVTNNYYYPRSGGIYQLNTKGFVPKGNVEIAFNF